MSEIFPFLSIPSEEPSTSLPEYREWAYDFEAEKLKVTDGTMQLLSGKPALAVWVYKAIRTQLNRYPIYSPMFGSELEALLGQGSASVALLADAERMLREAVMVSPYILGVLEIRAEVVEDARLRVSATLETLYGNAPLEVIV